MLFILRVKILVLHFIVYILVFLVLTVIITEVDLNPFKKNI
jgi:hypothetical protein